MVWPLKIPQFLAADIIALVADLLQSTSASSTLTKYQQLLVNLSLTLSLMVTMRAQLWQRWTRLDQIVKQNDVNLMYK